ncbi:cupin domain-containing protein [Thiohalocapsa sp. ML1]|jgi:quercetin dioxygenase-like cupin family protein|uniref:cupin domain-containing protein n=1 Tax=Thiohalocapsa sp. ML1 TaxID=1431688 RepID=UPI0007320699|nr:cupin domain-containing protein [Thiohalocapsa sp. ML1]
MQVEHWHEERDGPLTERALRDKIASRGFSVSRYVYPPGTFFPAHDHGVDKIDGVVSGRLRLTMSGQEAVLEAGDLLLVPKHVMHTAEVVGEEPVVSMDGVRVG